MIDRRSSAISLSLSISVINVQCTIHRLRERRSYTHTHTLLIKKNQPFPEANPTNSLELVLETARDRICRYYRDFRVSNLSFATINVQKLLLMSVINAMLTIHDYVLTRGTLPNESERSVCIIGVVRRRCVHSFNFWLFPLCSVARVIEKYIFRDGSETVAGIGRRCYQNATKNF